MSKGDVKMEHQPEDDADSNEAEVNRQLTSKRPKQMASLDTSTSTYWSGGPLRTWGCKDDPAWLAACCRSQDSGHPVGERGQWSWCQNESWHLKKTQTDG